MTHPPNASSDSSASRTRPWKAILTCGIPVILAGVAVTGLLTGQRRALARQAEVRRRAAEAGPLVKALTVGGPGTSGALVVPGEALPYQSTTLFARASGFLKEIRVDKGTPVRKGQLLAVIEGPELERDLDALKADAENKRRNASRLASLFRDQLVSARDAEQADADARVSEAKLSSLGITKAYQEIRAPFDGVVTQRFVDPGAVVQNASGSTSAQPVVTVDQVARLRVTFYLGQDLAGKVKAGDPVRIWAGPDPAQAQPAKVSRMAGALDPRTRTLLAEADLDNRQGGFVPRGAVQVSIGRPGQDGFMVPLEAVAQRQGQAVALAVDAASRVHLLPVRLGEDNGQKVRVLQGLKPGDRVILNPPAGLGEGAPVRLAGAGAAQ
jgi:RND family efflux transporter MFP subunit